jgi:hypothetical protein
MTEERVKKFKNLIMQLWPVIERCVVIKFIYVLHTYKDKEIKMTPFLHKQMTPFLYHCMR